MKSIQFKPLCILFEGGGNSQLDLVHLSLCYFNGIFSQQETWFSETMVVHPSTICCMITKWHQTAITQLGKEINIDCSLLLIPYFL